MRVLMIVQLVDEREWLRGFTVDWIRALAARVERVEVLTLEQGQADLPDIIHSVGDNRLHVIPCGPRVNDRAVQLLSSNKMISVLNRLRHKYDHVIIDTPPVVDLADAGILGGMSDDVLLIARMNHTPKTLIEQAVRTLASYNAPVSGMIATDHPRSRGRYYYRKYGYRYRYSNYRYYYAKAS